MLSWISGFLGGIFGWLASVLPNSPFTGIADGLNGLTLGLGYLNWFIPIGSFGAVFALYLSVLVVWTVIAGILDKSITGVFSAIGGGE